MEKFFGWVVGIIVGMLVLAWLIDQAEKYVSENQNTNTIWETIKSISKPITNEDILKDYKGDMRLEGVVKDYIKMGMRVYDRRILFHDDEYTFPRETYIEHYFAFVVNQPCTVISKFDMDFPGIRNKIEYSTKPYIFENQYHRWIDRYNGREEICVEKKLKAFAKITELVVLIQDIKVLERTKRMRH